ncbi:MAG: DUF1801 domain-containing protein [Okeania sp. SIO3B3]|nr:DUF1801 domain-containing protein [Okeania sp. SIO3B3]
MRSSATTVADYLAELTPDQRTSLDSVRRTILDHLPAGYEEAMNGGMITYQVPLEVCPNTYNGKPLMYAALVAQKHHMSLYLMGVYSDEGDRQTFETAYQATGKRLDMGKSCVRFKKLADLPLELIGNTIAALPMNEFVKRMDPMLRKPKRKQALS